ncbi:hypothetical protein NG726_14360 [Pseudomonas sp. MOB-449]|nr:hypothetical protein [Pseudomonas sp. MOB-449]
MKACLRRCLILLISLALPLSGMAGMMPPAEPCPMMASGMAMVDGQEHDCCSDKASAFEHGKPCKPGQECKSGSLLQVPAIKAPVRLSSPLAVSLAGGFLPSRTPASVWRPPCA